MGPIYLVTDLISKPERWPAWPDGLAKTWEPAAAVNQPSVSPVAGSSQKPGPAAGTSTVRPVAAATVWEGDIGVGGNDGIADDVRIGIPDEIVEYAGVDMGRKAYVGIARAALIGFPARLDPP